MLGYIDLYISILKYIDLYISILGYRLASTLNPQAIVHSTIGRIQVQGPILSFLYL